jgi:2-hydroxy-6-oxonona-2,4-dienedioate hydrolase
MEKGKISYTVVNKVAKSIGQSMPRGKLVGEKISVDNLSIFYRVSVDSVSPEQPAIVMVPGLVVSGQYLLPTARLLAPYYRVYVPDPPGFGKSGRPNYVLNVSEEADALAHWMQALGLKHAVLLANSYGCQVITCLVLRYPDLVQSEVLVGPTVDPYAPSIFQQIPRLLLGMKREPFSLDLLALENYLHGNPWRIIRTTQFMLQDHIENRLPHIQVPVLIACGSRDPIVSQRWAEEATALLPHGELIVVEGGGHALNYDSPSALTQITRSFIARACQAVNKDIA